MPADAAPTQALAKVAPPPDTSAAWKAEADRLGAELQDLQDDRELLLQDLAASRDALSKHVSQRALRSPFLISRACLTSCLGEDACRSMLLT